MQITITTNIGQAQAALAKVADQVPVAAANAINKTALQVRSDVQAEMQRVFDRPTSWAIDSLRVKLAQPTDLTAHVGFADKDSADFQGGARRSMIEPHVNTGVRHFKAMEARLMNLGLIPAGYNVVPGAAATLDAYGNMSQGQINQLLNVLGTYTETGGRVAKKGGVKKNTYGSVYWVNKVGGNDARARHLQPGVYQRVSTPFGSSLKPILIFVKQANYKQRLDFFGIVNNTINRDFANNFDEAFGQAVATESK